VIDIIKPDKKFSRRELLTGTGKLAIGAALISAGGAALVSNAEARVKYPWPYKKVDPDRAAEIAYENWYKGFCCYAVASGILVPLREMVGEPYTSFPIEAVKWGHGGVIGWGTMCGTLLGAGFAISLAAGHPGEKVLNEVIHWYSETELPIYKPKNPKAVFKATSVSNSPLCHISVGKWMAKEGVKFFSPQRKDRCARLAADIAAETARLLNAWADGRFKPAHAPQAKIHQMTAQNNCGDCHSK